MGKAKAHLYAVGNVRVSFDDADWETCGDAVDEHIAVVAARCYKLIIPAQEAGLLDVCLYIAMPCTAHKIPSESCPVLWKEGSSFPATESSCALHSST